VHGMGGRHRGRVVGRCQVAGSGPPGKMGKERDQAGWVAKKRERRQAGCPTQKERKTGRGSTVNWVLVHEAGRKRKVFSYFCFWFKQILFNTNDF
jgi:hypothetical protein